MPSINTAQTAQLKDILEKSPIIPVVAINDINDALPIANGFLNAGISNIEIVLRTSHGLGAITKISENISEMIIGAGTVLSKQHAIDAIKAGAQYIVSPGYSDDVADICLNAAVPYLPGAVTATEIQQASNRGFSYLKFFPAEAMGGIKTIKSFAAVFSDIQFCATGGVTMDNAKSYLDLPNVISVGTSALLTKDMQIHKNWPDIANHI